jgi:hypothetical protein
VLSVESQLTFRRNIWPPVCCSACYLLHADFLLILFFDPKDEGDMFLPKCLLTFDGLQYSIDTKLL